MFLVPWLTPPTLTKPNFKQELTSAKSIEFGRFINGNRYDLSCVDEQNLADLYDESVAQHLLKRNRSLLDGSTSDSHRSSFVLFTIVSEENQRDISAYSSYQDLAANCDTVTNFSNSVRNFFHGSHSSLFSLNHSHVMEPPNLQSIPEVVCDTRDSETCVLVHDEGNLETVQEEKEIVNKYVEEECKKTPTTDIEIVVPDTLDNCNHDYEESGTKETDMSDKMPHEGIAEEGFAINLNISESDLSCDSKKSSSQLSTGTTDSGFDEWKEDFLITGSDSGSSTSLIEKPSLLKDIPSRSCSCVDFSALPKAKETNEVLLNKSTLTSLSQNLSDRCQSEMDIDSYSYSDASFESEERHGRVNKKGDVSIECQDLIDSCQSEEDYYNDVVINLYPEMHDNKVADEGLEDLDIIKNNG